MATATTVNTRSYLATIVRARLSHDKVTFFCNAHGEPERAKTTRNVANAGTVAK